MQGKLILQRHQLCLCVFLKQSFLREITNTCIMNKNSLRPPQHSEILSVLTVSAWSKYHARSPVISSQLQALVSLQPRTTPSYTKSQDFPAKAAFPSYYWPHCFPCPCAQLIIRLADCSFTEPPHGPPPPKTSPAHALTPAHEITAAASILVCLILDTAPRPASVHSQSSQDPTQCLMASYFLLHFILCLLFQILHTLLPCVLTRFPTTLSTYILCPRCTVGNSPSHNNTMITPAPSSPWLLG